MTPELENIKAFLSEKGRLLNWRGIEIEASLPKSCIQAFMQYGQAEPLAMHLNKLLPILQRLGYTNAS